MTARTSTPVLRMRQVLLFLVAIVLPCALLVGLTVRMLVQERELADKRAVDARRNVALEVRRVLLDRVEQLRQQALASLAHKAGSSPWPAELLFVMRVENGRVVLPWESSSGSAQLATALDEPRFRAHVAAGERDEFVTGRFAEAAASYQRAVQAATLAGQRASANLLAVRALVKAHRPAEALAIARRVVEEDASLVDDQGIPFALYAAGLVADSSAAAADVASVVETIRQVLAMPDLGPAALYMSRDVAQRMNADEVLGRVNLRTRDIEQVLELRSSLAAVANAPATAGDPVWITFGPTNNLWLFNVATATDGAVVAVVRAKPLLAHAPADAVVTTSGDGELLTPSFPSLRVSLSPTAISAIAAETRLQRPFYLAALVLVVSVAFCGGYLFWRDVRRDMRVAELRSQFVSSVSHELKTPLTAIRMFAETLLMGRTRPDVQLEYLETIVNESERLTRLLNNVLDFSKIERGTKTYRLEPVSLTSVVTAAVKAMEYPFAQQGLELRVRIADDIPTIAADFDAIEQAILNLLSNAMKYSGDGRVVDLALERVGAEVAISVTDRGAGIPPQEQTKIFEQFYRIPNEATSRVPGTGLGLTLVDHVAKGHGGAVRIDSAPGRGSTFAIVLPTKLTA